MEHTVVLADAKTVERSDQKEILEAASASIRVLDEKTEAAVVEAVQGADGIIVDAATPVTARAIDATDTLRVVGRSGVGVDNIDVGTATENGVTVVNVPDYALEEVSTHALTLLLSCVRAVPRYDRAVKGGTWDWTTGRPIERFSSGTLGLVGFGRIARRLAAKLRTFGVDVVATDPYVDAATMHDYGVEKVSFDGLLDRVDYLSIHVPLYEDTRHLFSTAEFERLRDGCVVVNTSRGAVVDEAALVAALDAGEIAMAGLDVLETEPPDADSPLLERDDVVLTPHAAWYSDRSREELSAGVASGVVAALRGETPPGVVDPEKPWIS